MSWMPSAVLLLNQRDAPAPEPPPSDRPVYPEGLRRVLVENGTLNPDFSPSEATAARLGWKLLDRDDERACFFAHAPSGSVASDP